MGTLTCCQIDLEKLFNGGFSTGHGHLREPQDIASYAALAAIAIQSDQNDQHGGQSIPAFDFYLAKGVAKTFRKEYRSNINRALELFVSLDNNADEAFAKVEEKTNTTAKLDMEPVFVEAIREMLRNEYHLDDEKVELVVNFTYKESLKATKKKTYQAMEGFVHNLNTMHSRAGAQVPFFKH